MMSGDTAMIRATPLLGSAQAKITWIISTLAMVPL